MVTRMFAVDLGASGGKCFAATLENGAFQMQEVHRFEHEAVSFFTEDRQGHSRERTCWDDTLLYRNVLTGLRTYRREVADRLDGIGLDTWGADGNLMSANGDLLGQVYCYRDHRLDAMIERVKARIDAQRVYEITGIHFQPFNVSNQLHWLVMERPELLLPGSFYLPIPALFYYYLCGSRAVDTAWASVTQLMDARRRVWSTEILQALSIPESIMPPIVSPGAVMGQLPAALASSLGLNRARLIATAAHDTACAFAAAPVANPDEAMIVSSGTWSLCGKLVREPVTTPVAMAAQLSNEGGVGNVRLLRNGMGTWLVQELRRGWAAADGRALSWEELTALAERAPAFATVINPDDPSFYNPADMETAIRDFCIRVGEPVPRDRGGFIRAVYEGLALSYRAVNEDLCRVSGTITRAVHIVGGGSKNAVLNQFVADALNLPVHAGPEEATAVGNFMIQAMGLGAIATLAEAQPIIKAAFPIRRFEPQPSAAWDRAYARLQALRG